MFTLTVLFVALTAALASYALIGVTVLHSMLAVAAVRAEQDADRRFGARTLEQALLACEMADRGAYRDTPIARRAATLAERLMGARVALRRWVACSPTLRALRRPVRRFAAPVAATVALSLALGACAVAPLAGDEVRQTVKALVVRGITAARAAKEVR